MKKPLAIALFLLAATASAQIAFDAEADSGGVLNFLPSITWNRTVTGSNTYIVVAVAIEERDGAGRHRPARTPATPGTNGAEHGEAPGLSSVTAHPP